jgi:hypothetical protein
MGTHLWFVLTDPDPDRNSMVLVMLVTVKLHTDRTLHLHVGDHPFVRHESAVDFGTATYVPAVRLQEGLASGRAALAADMSADLLARVAPASSPPHALPTTSSNTAGRCSRSEHG